MFILRNLYRYILAISLASVCYGSLCFADSSAGDSTFYFDLHLIGAYGQVAHPSIVSTPTLAEFSGGLTLGWYFYSPFFFCVSGEGCCPELPGTLVIGHWVADKTKAAIGSDWIERLAL